MRPRQILHQAQTRNMPKEKSKYIITSTNCGSVTLIWCLLMSVRQHTSPVTYTAGKNHHHNHQQLFTKVEVDTDGYLLDRDEESKYPPLSWALR